MDLTGYCPRCGIKFNARYSSVGTVRRCQGCGFKFVLTEPPVAPIVGSGCTAAVVRLVILGAFAILLMGAGLAAVRFLLHQTKGIAERNPPTQVPAPPSSPAPDVSPSAPVTPPPANIFTPPPPATLPTLVSTPPCTTSPTALAPLADRVAAAKRAIGDDAASLNRAEEACFARLTNDPYYAAAVKAKETASEAARAAATGNGDLTAASHALSEATQELSDMRRVSLDADKAVAAARANVAADEAVLVSLLQEQGVQVVAEAPADAGPTPIAAAVGSSRVTSGVGRSFGATAVRGSGDGEVFVRGYYRKDGTYVSPHTRSAPGSGAGRGRR